MSTTAAFLANLTAKDYLLYEDGDKVVLENGTGFILLEQVPDTTKPPWTERPGVTGDWTARPGVSGIWTEREDL